MQGGININDAITYMTTLSGMSADKDKYGKSITGSKKDKVCAYINGLNLTSEQKDILYLYLYKENSLKYTPWHGYTGKKSRRRGGGRRRKAAKATSIKQVGQLAKGYDTSIDISTLFGTPAQKSGKSGDASAEDELLELIEALSRRRRYFRLKSGEFLDLSGLEGVRDRKDLGDAVSFLYSGGMEALLKALAAGKVTDLSVSEPDLEELFMHFYEGGAER